MATILVVDDPQILGFLRSLFSDEGYVVLTASNGQEALLVIEQLRTDLVLSDVQMPLLSGPELLRAIREGPNYLPIPVVLMSAARTGSPELDDLDTLFLRKPLNVDDLLRIVEQLLNAAAPLE